jgi:hypothetical protein
MKRKELTSEDFYNYWLVKFHGITVQELIEKEPELCKTSDWYKKYACTQEQHDEWLDWAVDTIAKYYRCGKETARKRFVWDYLNLSPSIK